MAGSKKGILIVVVVHDSVSCSTKVLEKRKNGLAATDAHRGESQQCK